MKKYLVLLFALVLLLTGCSFGKKSNPLIGKWRIDKIQNGPVIIEFKKNNKITYTSANYEKTGTYKIDGNIVTVNGIWDEEEEYEYVITDSKLTLRAIYVNSLSYEGMIKEK